MRRISLALALLGAVAAAGCGGAGGKSPASSSGNKGVEDASFKLVVRGEGAYLDPATSTTIILPKGGVVTASAGGINCGVDGTGGLHKVCEALIPYSTALVTLTAKPNTPTYNVWMWAGACSGTASCSFAMTDTQTVGIRFAADVGSLGAHGPFTDHRLHGLEYFKVYVTKTSPLTCTTSSCHGAQLQGVGLAPACTSCHPFSVETDMQSPNMSYDTHGHFDPNGQFDHGGTCGRCHTTGGFLDYVGVTSATINGATYTFPGNKQYLIPPGSPTNLAGLDGPLFVATTAWNAPATATATAGAGYAYMPTNIQKNKSMDPVAIVSTDGSYVYGVPFKCQTCHNPVADVFTGLTPGATGLTVVNLTSGQQIATDNATALCAQCHAAGAANQPLGTFASRGSLISSSWGVEGIASGSTSLWPAAATADTIFAPATVFTTVFPTNNNTAIIPYPHGLIAASTYFGSAAATYYQYPGKTYDGPNPHGACTDCHGAHTLDVNATAQTCGNCHFSLTTGAAVNSLPELAANRQYGFTDTDVDGNGHAEGLDVEIFGTTTAQSCHNPGTACAWEGGLVNKLAVAIQTYANVVAGQSICWTSSFPGHFYIYGAPAGTVTPTDPWTPVAVCPSTVVMSKATVFTAYTPALVRALYNYQAIYNDPGAWAHNPRYAIEILFDSITDLNRGIVAKGGAAVPFAGKRSFNGHFGAADAATPYAAFPSHGASCDQCHGGQAGLEAYLAGMPAAQTVAVPGVTGMQCGTCHTSGANMKGLRTVPTVYFPPEKGNPPAASQKVVAFAAANLPDSFALCGTCHSGRENGATIDALVAGVSSTSFTLAFKNPHYLGAAGMIMGSDAGVLYQYAGQTYAGRPVFWKTGTNGNAPGPYGSPHGAECTGCHQPVASQHSFEVDFNYCGGCHNGTHLLAPIKTEVDDAAAELNLTIQKYATANIASAGTGVCYNPNGGGTYFFQQAALLGTETAPVACGASDTTAFKKFNPALLKAAFNLQWWGKEPGAYAHNEAYMMEAMYDSIVDLGYTPTFARP